MPNVLFIGEETRLLKAIVDQRAEVVGVYGYRPSLNVLRPKSLLCRSYHIRQLVRRHKGFFKSWQKYCVRFQTSDFARRLGLPVDRADNINKPSLYEAWQARCPDIGVIASSAAIIREPLLSLPVYGWINFHPSLLPLYRGPEPVLRALLNGDQEFGVTWHRVAAKLDAGDIVTQVVVKPDAGDSAKEIHERCVDQAITMLATILSDPETMCRAAYQQAHERATYFPPLSAEEKTKARQCQFLPR